MIDYKEIIVISFTAVVDGVTVDMKSDSGDVFISYKIGDSSIDERIANGECNIEHIKKEANRVKSIDANRKTKIYQRIYHKKEVVEIHRKGVHVWVSMDMGDIFLKFSYKGEVYAERVDFGADIESIINETVDKIISRKGNND